MKWWKAVLAVFLVLCLVVTVAGCRRDDPRNGPGTDPGSDPGNDPGSDPGSDPGTDPGSDPGTDPGNHTDNNPDKPLDVAVTPVPSDQLGLVDKAIIRQGDLWLGSYDGQYWRQTNTGDVVEVVWAPNGHGLAYLRATSPTDVERDLYYLALGEAPLRIAEDITAYKTWLNESGWLWNPDSDSIAYAIDNGSKIRVTWLQDMTHTVLNLNEACYLGPYWLSPGIMVYTTATERPTTVIINAVGQILNSMADSSLPYPIPDGLIIATGTYDPDGVMETFYYTGLARTNPDGSDLTQVYDQSVRFCLMARDPVLPGSPTLPKYLAISDSQNLFLRKYAGPPSKAFPNQVELMSQDLFLTYSEFSYPLWFSWAPNGSGIAALRFTLTQPGNYGEQEGFWDLVLVDEDANLEVILVLIRRLADPGPARTARHNYSWGGSFRFT